jgi:hypothetical protein
MNVAATAASQDRREEPSGATGEDHPQSLLVTATIEPGYIGAV